MRPHYKIENRDAHGERKENPSPLSLSLSPAPARVEGKRKGVGFDPNLSALRRFLPDGVLREPRRRPAPAPYRRRPRGGAASEAG